jgi:hypothetical protein
MTVQVPLHMDKAAFLAWAEGRQERYELVEGPAVMMTRPRCAHAIIVGNLIVALRRRRDSRKWAVIAGFGLDAGPRTLRFPDIVVDRRGDLDDRWATGPVLLAEVLSGPAERPTWRTNPRSFYDSQASKPILCLRSARRRYGNGCVRLAPLPRNLARSPVWMRSSRWQRSKRSFR